MKHAEAKPGKVWETAVAALALTLAMSAQAADIRVDEETEFRPTGRGQGEVEHDRERAQEARNARAAAAAAAITQAGIRYHGGPVMLNGANVYYIWYGNWAGNSATNILTDLANGIGGSPYFNINNTYTNSAGTRILNRVSYRGAVNNAYSHGTALTDANIAAVVTNAINSGALGAKDPDGVYFVLTSSDVNATSGFCTRYCGWHNKMSVGGTTIKYSFVGNADRCPSACSSQTTSPNGNAGADAMASILTHELEETVTDPELNAWYDTRGNENADKCAWTFGATTTAANGAKSNVALGARRYLIQQNWVNAGTSGSCAMQYP